MDVADWQDLVAVAHDVDVAGRVLAGGALVVPQLEGVVPGEEAGG